jgi:hypothetical protein
MIHRYPRARRVVWIATDLLLVAVAVWFAITPGRGTLGIVLSIAAPIIVAWNLITLHYPRFVDIDDRSVSFGAYGRVHRYEWSDVERVHVRKFLVRDRVLVRIVPSPPWQGRYWILSTIDRYDELLRELESHRKT